MMSSENTTLSVADEIPFKLSQSLTEVTNMQGEAEHVGDLSYFLMPFTTEDAENDVLVMAEEAFSTTREARFKGQLIHGKQFADIIQSLGEDFGQAVVECSSTGLRISGMCNTHISLAEVVLFTKDFSSLECNQAFVLGCEFKNFARIMQDVKENDVVGLAIRETIEVSVHCPSDQHELSLKEIECDDNVEILTPPRIPYSATVSIPPLLLRDILTTLEGTTCEIGITRDGILFSTDSGSLSILNAAESDDQFAFKVKKAGKLVFNLSRLQMFANKDSIAPRQCTCRYVHPYR